MTPEPEIRFKNFLAGRPRSYRETDPAKLQQQINDLSDLLLLVIKERDKLSEANREQQKKLDRLKYVNLKFWILGGVVAAQFGIIGFLAEQLFSRLK